MQLVLAGLVSVPFRTLVQPFLIETLKPLKTVRLCSAGIRGWWKRQNETNQVDHFNPVKIMPVERVDQTN